MPTTYIANSIRPYVYAEGVTNKPLIGFVPQTGVPQIPVTLNQTFFMEAGSVFVPQIGSSGENVTGWRTTFVNPGAPVIKKVMLLSNSLSATLEEGYDFFNKTDEAASGADIITNGVMRILAAGTVSNGRRIFSSNYKNMLLSMRGAFTVNRALFPYTASDNPVPSRNTNGVQDGSLITFHTQDWFSIYVFEQPQDISTKLNILPQL